MTAQPRLTDFTTTIRKRVEAEPALHPQVAEKYWGYELSMSRRSLTFVEASRAIATGLSVVSLCAAASLWSTLGSSDGLGILWAVFGSAVLLAACVFFALISFRGTRVRVQVDTAAGELREVVDAGFGTVDVLARYGLDTVASVAVVPSRETPSVGQIQVRLNGYGTIPVVDGAVTALRPLAQRLETDCGLCSGSAAEAVWSGPLDHALI